MHTVLFVGGGSVGHIAPSIAVWEALSSMRKDVTAHFVCSTRSTDAPYLRHLGLPFTPLDAPRIGVSLLLKGVRALCAAQKILERQMPDVVFSTGGYVSAPLIIAAWQKKIPVMLLEPEALPGKTNRLLGRFAVKTYRGTPVRSCMTRGSRERGRTIAGVREGRPVLLVMGGSQGAEAINRCIFGLTHELLQTMDIIHITGAGKLPANVQGGNTPGYCAMEFANEELPHFYAAADVTVSRAGASSIAELAANGIPSVLVPLHRAQHANALRAHDTNAHFVVCPQVEMQEHLAPLILSLLGKRVHGTHGTDGQDSRHISEIISQCLDSGAIPE
ncbi:glycosyltransferase [Candidatus Peregrinibacteria bacterium]|nr:glycosyltransferase [Candidatus Peregrinibacteria bacterium]